MSGISAIQTTALSYGQAAFSTGAQIKRAFEGDPRRVQFVRDSQVLIQFDAVLQEGHAVEAGPTVFPLEDGQTISDHIILAPVELSLTAIVVDAPLDGDDQDARNAALIKEGISSVANFVLGPVGVLGATAAFAGQQAASGARSRAFAAYETLRKLTEGEPDAVIPIPPTPFDVKTRLRTYKNMVIKSLQAPRDATTGAALVFNIALSQLRLVQPQSVTLALSKIPDTASIKEKLSEEDAYLENQFKAGDNRVHVIAGQAAPFPVAGVQP